MTITNNESPISNLGLDKFQYDNDVLGLSKFISGVQTPFTISIQGEWGSGKTSFINMVLSVLLELKEDDNIQHLDVIENNEYKVIRLNAWDFTQFSDDSISNSMLKYLASVIVKEEENIEQLNTILDNRYTNAIVNSMMEIAEISIPFLAIFSKHYRNSIKKENKKKEERLETARKYSTTVEKINKFKDMLESEIKNNGKTHIIFIDDLDRIHPNKVVEILESIQVFMSLENCIFILAVDYNIVNQGFKNKFKEFKNEVDASKYFDKLIQLAIELPVVEESITGTYIVELFKCFEGYEINAEEQLIIESIVLNAIGDNPRSIKSLVNSLLLQSNIHSVKNGEEIKYDLVHHLFFEGLSLRYKPFYDFLLLRSKGQGNDLEVFEYLIAKLTSDRELFNFDVFEAEIFISDSKFIDEYSRDILQDMVLDINESIIKIGKQNGQEFEENAQSLFSYLKNFEPLFLDLNVKDTYKPFTDKFYDIIGQEKSITVFDTSSVKTEEDTIKPDTIARVAINSKDNELIFGQVQKLIRNWDINDVVRKVYLLRISEDYNQILIEFKHPVDKRLRDDIKQLLILNEIEHKSVTSHRQFYTDRAEGSDYEF